MIAFIIPAHNEEQLLGRTLLAVQRVAGEIGEPFEVLVVDDASTDRTAEVAREHGARVVSVQHRQIAKTRNSGAREAKGDIFIFIDADTEPTVEVVRAALEALRKGAVGGGSSLRFDGEVSNTANFCIGTLLWVSRWVGLACGCFVFATREAFEKCGGFDETLFAAEEWAVSRRLKREGRFVVLREQVITSARKMTQYSRWEVISQFGRIILKGPKALKSRKGLGLWYGERRVER